MINPTQTVTTNMPSCCKEIKTSSISAIRAATILHTPIGEYLDTIFVIDIVITLPNDLVKPYLLESHLESQIVSNFWNYL